jgi:hypothetical protein
MDQRAGLGVLEKNSYSCLDLSHVPFSPQSCHVTDCATLAITHYFDYTG